MYGSEKGNQSFTFVDFASPLSLPGSAGSTPEPDPESVMMIVSMGFTPQQATKALKATVCHTIIFYF